MKLRLRPASPHAPRLAKAGGFAGPDLPKCLSAAYLTDADPVKKEFVFNQLQSLAEYLLKTWPNAEESQQAANLLVQLALIAGDLDKAKNYVAVATNTSSGGKLRRQLGLSLWDDYNKHFRRVGPTLPTPPWQLQDNLRMTHCGKGVMDGGTSEKADVVAVEAALALINLWAIDGKMDDASKLLDDHRKGPLDLLEANADLAKEGTALSGPTKRPCKSKYN
jgi:hypothetical protein